MSQFLEYLSELQMQVTYIVEKEIESLSGKEIRKFLDLEEIEMELLKILNEGYKKVREDKRIALCDNLEVIEKLSHACIGLEKCLADKHNLLERLPSHYQG